MRGGQEAVANGGQLLKWIGSKHAYVNEMLRYFPKSYGRYYEPFLGSGAILGALKPKKALGSDAYGPLIEIFRVIQDCPDEAIRWYAERYSEAQETTIKACYERVRDSFNRHPNGADFLFLSRTCWGGVIRFTQRGGRMSTPVGHHKFMPPERFAKIAMYWHRTIVDYEFEKLDYREALSRPRRGDLVYCDPPYAVSQSILYGSQSFDMEDLIARIERLKSRGVMVAMSFDGGLKTGRRIAKMRFPTGLFTKEVIIAKRLSKLMRFKSIGKTMEDKLDSERLLLTY